MNNRQQIKNNQYQFSAIYENEDPKKGNFSFKIGGFIAIGRACCTKTRTFLLTLRM